MTWHRVEEVRQDLRYAVRTLGQKPGFAAVALLTLALGIAATTVMFTLINGVLLKPLPYREPDRLVAVHGHSSTWNVALFGDQNVAYPDFLDLERQSRSVDIAGWVYNGGTVSAPGEAEYVDAFELSSGLFSVLGVRPVRGRAFLPDEDRPYATPVAMLGYDFWRRHFAAKPDVIGTRVVFEGKPYTIIGIAPANFRLSGDLADLYTPLGQDTAKYLQMRGPHPVRPVARLKPGVALTQAQTEFAMIGHRLAEQYPDTNRDRTFVVQPLRPEVGDVRSTLWLLLGAVGMVLLIACVNIASLLLARAVSRERELALRAALGASRGRLARQCLTESALLGLTGGLLGICLAAVSLKPFVTFWPGSLPRTEEVALDWRVLLFAVAVSFASSILFGLAPALRAPSRDLEQTLRAGSRTLVGSSRRLHGGFVVSEIALAVVLLVCAGMLGRTMLRLSSLDPGIDVHNVLTARMALSPATMENPARIRAAWQDILERARAVPGVQAATIVDTVPMREGNNPIGYWTSANLPPVDKQPLTLATSVTPDYLKVMGIALHAGRFFNDQDRTGNQPVVVIDDVMARQAFGGREALGRHLWIGLGTDPVTVVGVVRHVRYWGLAGDDQAQVRAQLYYPFAQVPDGLQRRWSELMSIAVRTGITPMNEVEPLRHAVRGVTGDQVLYEIHTIEQLANASLARQRFLLLLFGIFAGLALLLACIGIYGVLAYLVSQRVPEIGIRIALGANARDVVQMVLRQSFAMILLGASIGICGALAAARVLERSVTGMRRTEPSTFALMISLLVIAALFASFLPARRASRVDPITALRQE